MTYNEIKKYIEENGIKKRSELGKKSKEVYKHFKNLSKDEQSILLPSKYSEKHYYGTSFSTVEDFQKFIDDNDIVRPVIFKRNYPKIYDRLCRVLSKNEKTELKYKNRIRSYSNIESVGDLQLFINNNEVHSRRSYTSFIQACM